MNNSTQPPSSEEVARKANAREQARLWHIKNKEKKRLYNKAYREKNKEKVKEIDKAYYVNNKKKKALKEKEYRANNKEKVSAYRRSYNKRILIRIANRLRNRIRSATMNTKSSKHANTEMLLGCSFEKVKEHLESLWLEGMSWENYGEWHIDHIRPCASFNLHDIEEQKKCCHYTNLQPLWGKDNDSKNSWYEGVRYFYEK